MSTKKRFKVLIFSPDGSNFNSSVQGLLAPAGNLVAHLVLQCKAVSFDLYFAFWDVRDFRMKRKIKVLIFDNESGAFTRWMKTFLLLFDNEFEFDVDYAWPISERRISLLAQQPWDLVLLDQYPGTEGVIAEFLGHWAGEKRKVINFDRRPLTGTTTLAKAVSSGSLDEQIQVIHSVLSK